MSSETEAAANLAQALAAYDTYRGLAAVTSLAEQLIPEQDRAPELAENIRQAREIVPAQEPEQENPS
jgi:hypothetical protein